ncbi:hypothetical protein MMC29_004926 [Sticta canariensis]|nr:hypothetical protein [Sticta canariensis]
MLNDPQGMTGGETMCQKADGSCVPVRFPTAGSAIVLQFRYQPVHVLSQHCGLVTCLTHGSNAEALTAEPPEPPELSQPCYNHVAIRSLAHRLQRRSFRSPCMGMEVTHCAKAAISQHQRITMVTSYVPANARIPDNSILSPFLRQASNQPLLFAQWSEYRLKALASKATSLAQVSDEIFKREGVCVLCCDGMFA